MIVPDWVSSVNPPNKFSRFSICTRNGKPITASHRFSSVFINSDNTKGEKEWEKLRYKPHSADLIAKVANTAVPFCGPIELTHLFNLESVNKLLPDLRSQPVAKHHPDGVLLFILRLRGGVQVPCYFPNILSTLKTKEVVNVFVIVTNKTKFSLTKRQNKTYTI